MCFVVTTYPFISCSFMGHGSKFQGAPCPPAPITVLPPVCHILGPRTEHVQAFQPFLWKLMTTVIPYDFPVILLVFTATWRFPTMGVLRLVALGSVPSKFQSVTKLSQAVKMTNEMMFPILNRYIPTAGKLIARPTRRPFSDHSATVAARGPFGCRWPRHVCVRMANLTSLRSANTSPLSQNCFKCKGPGKNSRAGQMTMKILRIAWTQKFF